MRIFERKKKFWDFEREIDFFLRSEKWKRAKSHTTLSVKSSKLHEKLTKFPQRAFKTELALGLESSKLMESFFCYQQTMPNITVDAPLAAMTTRNCEHVENALITGN